MKRSDLEDLYQSIQQSWKVQSKLLEAVKIVSNENTGISIGSCISALAFVLCDMARYVGWSCKTLQDYIEGIYNILDKEDKMPEKAN